MQAQYLLEFMNLFDILSKESKTLLINKICNNIFSFNMYSIYTDYLKKT